MPKIVTKGKVSHIARSWFALNKIAIKVYASRLIGKPLVQEWSADFEIGTLFWRHQFNHAFKLQNIAEGRAYFDSLQTYTGETFAVDQKPTGSPEPKGTWLTPDGLNTNAVLLYFHGGGYTFHAAISHYFSTLLAGTLKVKIFASDYRLTPENPHPAQIEDAISAYRYLLECGIDSAKIVIAGDSAGGHLALMSLIAIRDAKLPQPALAIGLCPWTDIGDHGASLTDNNKYDLVQGYMALKFGEWLKGYSDYTNQQLSPIYQDYRGLAPLYLQGGGKEILIDMIRNFANEMKHQGVDVHFDEWPHMTHVFQAHGATLPQSREALKAMREKINQYVPQNASGSVSG